MTVISTKSITGVTSITSPQSDDAVTLHTNDTTQRVSVTTGGMNVTGVVTATAFSGSGASLTALNGSNISSGTVATARLGSGTASSSTFLRGDGSWASNTSTTINSNADNRIITGSGTANTLEAESNFTYDGDEVAIYAQTDDTNAILHLVGKTASGGVGQAGRTAIIAESTHNSNGQSAMHLRTRNTSNAQLIAMTIDGNQNVGIGTQLPDNKLEIYKGSAGTYLKAGGDNSNNGRALAFTSSATSNSVDGGKHTLNATSAHGELALATNGAERLRITSSGRLLYGDHINDRGAELQYEGSQHACLGVHRNAASHGAPAIQLSASRGTSAGSNTIVQDDDYLGMLSFKGADGSDLANGAYITGIVDGTPGSNDMPTRLGFWTSADGSQSPTERLRIRSTGLISATKGNGCIDGTWVYKQANQSANYEHKIRGPLGGLLDTEMNTNSVAYIKVQCTGTGTNTAYCYYRWSQDGENLGATLTHIHGNSSSSSNNPWMVLDGQHPCWKTAHSTGYTYVVRVEITGGEHDLTFQSDVGAYGANP